MENTNACKTYSIFQHRLISNTNKAMWTHTHTQTHSCIFYLLTHPLRFLSPIHLSPKFLVLHMCAIEIFNFVFFGTVPIFLLFSIGCSSFTCHLGFCVVHCWICEIILKMQLDFHGDYLQFQHDLWLSKSVPFWIYRRPANVCGYLQIWSSIIV